MSHVVLIWGVQPHFTPGRVLVLGVVTELFSSQCAILSDHAHSCCSTYRLNALVMFRCGQPHLCVTYSGFQPDVQGWCGSIAFTVEP